MRNGLSKILSAALATAMCLSYVPFVGAADGGDVIIGSGEKRFHGILIQGDCNVQINNLKISGTNSKGYAIVASSSNGLVNGDSPTLTLDDVTVSGRLRGAVYFLP